MLLLDRCERGKQILELRVVGLGGIVGVLVNAQLFLILQILKKHGFFLRQLHILDSFPLLGCAFSMYRKRLLYAFGVDKPQEMRYNDGAYSISSWRNQT